MSKPDPLDFVMPGVRRFQYEDMRHYVRDCADILGLRDWTVDYFLVKPEFLEGVSCEAAINVVTTRRTFTIWLPPEWYANASEKASLANREEARNSVSHELLHVHFMPISNHVEQVQSNLGEAMWNLYESMYRERMEVFIDTVCMPLSQALPLPRIPAKYTPQNASPDAITRPEDV